MSLAEVVIQIFEDAYFMVVNLVDNTKRLMFDLSGSASGKTVTIKSQNQDDIELKLPTHGGTLDIIDSVRTAMVTPVLDFTAGEIVTLDMLGNFTLDIHNPMQGKSLLLIVEPNTFSMSFHAYVKIISGKFNTKVTNYIYFHCIDGTTPVYVATIGQQIA